jgi:hypothetical protein
MNSRLALKDNISGVNPASPDLGTEGSTIRARLAATASTDRERTTVDSSSRLAVVKAMDHIQLAQNYTNVSKS